MSSSFTSLNYYLDRTDDQKKLLDALIQAQTE